MHTREWLKSVIGYGGANTSRRNMARIQEAGWGMVITPQNPKRLPCRYMVDNGAFYCWQKKKDFDKTAFLKMLDRVTTFRSAPDFAVCPDILAGGRRSLDFSIEWAHGGRLPAEWAWYVAVQDGMIPATLTEVVAYFKGIFLGGSSEWKMRTMHEWALFARSNAVKFHVGRVNSLSRGFYAAKVCRADSFDGTSWSRTMSNAAVPSRMVNLLNSQKCLDLYGLDKEQGNV